MILRILITVVSLLLFLAHRLKVPWATINDKSELTLIVIAVLPWLATVFKSVDIPGVGKFDLQELKKQVAENHGDIQSVRQQVTGAVQSLENRADAALQVLTVTPNVDANPEESTPLVQELDFLSDLYISRRNSLEKSAERTAEMSTIFGKMVAVCARIESIDASPYLDSGDAGKRLVGYARLYARPESTYLSQLVETITSGLETTPFGQYWGIRALARVVEEIDSKAVPSSLKSKLADYCAKLAKDTDRYFELSKLAQIIGFECSRPLIR